MREPNGISVFVEVNGVELYCKFYPTISEATHAIEDYKRIVEMLGQKDMLRSTYRQLRYRVELREMTKELEKPRVVQAYVKERVAEVSR